VKTGTLWRFRQFRAPVAIARAPRQVTEPSGVGGACHAAAVASDPGLHDQATAMFRIGGPSADPDPPRPPYPDILTVAEVRS
jgi:hypothetical protein